MPQPFEMPGLGCTHRFADAAFSTNRQDSSLQYKWRSNSHHSHCSPPIFDMKNTKHLEILEVALSSWPCSDNRNLELILKGFFHMNMRD